MSAARRGGGAGGALAAIGFGVAVIGLALALIVTMQSLAARQREAARLTATADSLRAALDAATSRDAARPDAGAAHLLREHQVMALRRRGLADPVADLVADLERHPELIPYPGIMGGTMAFRDPVHVLNDRWVLAAFEDGHIGGTMLLEYRVENGRITWKRLAAIRD